MVDEVVCVVVNTVVPVVWVVVDRLLDKEVVIVEADTFTVLDCIVVNVVKTLDWDDDVIGSVVEDIVKTVVDEVVCVVVNTVVPGENFVDVVP